MAGLKQRMRDYEAGFMDADDTTRLFQELVDQGLVWNLGERYQRIARALLEAGMVSPAHGAAALEEEEEAFEDPAEWLVFSQAAH